MTQGRYAALASADELEAALREIGAERYHILHPFHRLLHTGRLDRGQVQAWALNRYYYQSRIPMKDAALLSRCADRELRREWLVRILDHDGLGEQEGGIARWLRLCEGLGLAPDYVRSEEGILPATKFAVDAYVRFVRDQTLLEAVASSLTELFAPKIHEERIPGLLQHYDFVSEEMVAYFRDNDVYRFDALGGASAILFLKERDSAITLMNQKESKILSAHIIDRKIQRIKYVENLKSDVRPTYKLPLDKQRLKNFNWRISEMPRSRWELTDRKVNASQRGTLAKIIFPDYPQTKIYFPKSYEAITALAKSIDKKIAAENAAEAKQAEAERANKAAANKAAENKAAENKPVKLIGIQKAEPADVQNAKPANVQNAKPADVKNAEPIKNTKPAK